MADLKTQLAQGGPLDPASAVRVVHEVAAAIDEAHAHPSVHRHVTTDTIVLAGDGSAYLSDGAGTTPSTDRTRALVTNSEAGYRADIYALAAVLYECLTGQPPDAAAEPPSRWRAGIPTGFDAVLAKGLAANPDDRYRTAAELAAAAQNALTTPAADPSSAVTRTIRLPPRPNPPPPQWDPVPGGSPTLSYPHPRPVMLAPPTPRRRVAPVIAVLAIVTAVVVGAIVIPKLVRHPAGPPAAKPTTSTSAPPRSYTGLPTALPFPGLDGTKSVSVDGTGNVYVLAALVPEGPFESLPTKLFKLAPGGGDATTVDIPGVNLRGATDLEVDQSGNIYYSDGGHVWVLGAGKTSPIRLQFRGFSSIQAIAVDGVGNVYAVGALTSPDLQFKYGVKKLAPGQNRPTDLSFGELYVPRAIAVDKSGNVYVSSGVKGSGHGEVLKLPAGATATSTLAIPDLLEPRQVAFDSAGDIFIADGFGRKFFELPAGGGSPIKIPLPANVHGVAVDSADNVYVVTTTTVTDQSNKIVQPGQVLKIVPDK